MKVFPCTKAPTELSWDQVCDVEGIYAYGQAGSALIVISQYGRVARLWYHPPSDESDAPASLLADDNRSGMSIRFTKLDAELCFEIRRK